MSHIQIYDSEGTQVGSDTSTTNERIQDFFFAGVRLAVDTVGTRATMTVFFRARESQKSRSEQYYAVFETDARRQLFTEFERRFREQVESELDMEVVTGSEDTEIFEAVIETGESTVPGSQRDIEDLRQLLENGSSIRVGVQTYRHALGLLNELATSRNADKIAIAENAQSRRLDEYDIVIEKGSHSGITFIGNTEQALERLRERRRRRLRGSDEYGPTGLKAYFPGFLQPYYAPIMIGVTILGIGLVAVGAVFGANVLLGKEIPYLGYVFGGPEKAQENVTVNIVDGTPSSLTFNVTGPKNMTKKLPNSTIKLMRVDNGKVIRQGNMTLTIGKKEQLNLFKEIRRGVKYNLTVKSKHARGSEEFKARQEWFDSSEQAAQNRDLSIQLLNGTETTLTFSVTGLPKGEQRVDILLMNVTADGELYTPSKTIVNGKNVTLHLPTGKELAPGNQYNLTVRSPNGSGSTEFDADRVLPSATDGSTTPPSAPHVTIQTISEDRTELTFSVSNLTESNPTVNVSVKNTTSGEIVMNDTIPVTDGRNGTVDLSSPLGPDDEYNLTVWAENWTASVKFVPNEVIGMTENGTTTQGPNLEVETPQENDTSLTFNVTGLTDEKQSVNISLVNISLENETGKTVLYNETKNISEGKNITINLSDGQFSIGIQYKLIVTLGTQTTQETFKLDSKSQTDQ